MAENIINVPNILTILRFLLMPVFLYFVMIDKVELALVTFMFVAVTDLADGWIARTTGAKTKFGEFLDPLADKFMVFIAIIALILKFDLPLWSVPFIILRDIISLGGSIITHAIHKENWKPNIFGKLTTFFQIALIVAFIVDVRIKFIILYITIFFSFISAVIYAHRGIMMLYKYKTKKI